MSADEYLGYCEQFLWFKILINFKNEYTTIILVFNSCFYPNELESLKMTIPLLSYWISYSVKKELIVK